MDNHTIELLEFDRIRETVASYCLSEEGSGRVLQDPIFRIKSEVEYYLDLTFLFRRILTSGVEFPSLPFPPISPYLDNLNTDGIVLEEEALHRIASFVSSSSTMQRYVSKAMNQLSGGGETEQRAINYMEEAITSIPDLNAVVSTIRKVIDNEGNIREDLPELRSIRDTVRSINRQISALAGSYFNNRDLSHVWQDTNPVQREGRVVLPLKTPYRGKVRGIVHEVSATGATLFIEPMDIVEKNNVLIEQENRFRQEVHKILRQTTKEVQFYHEELGQIVSQIAVIDSLYARAKYSEERKCTRPLLMKDGFLLRNARHPLLGREAVPISLEIGEGVRALIISGPNTGGKTVGLKTAGLMVLMNQFGLGIPADEESSLPLFDGVFADIGDEQSIDQSLSTFSGHMKQIASIIDMATEDSLILLDEIGSGTDVKEGSSLAMALLDHFIVKNCTVLATTHQGLLKHYGFTKPQVENASVDFNTKTLQPTYSIIQGMPGESHALEIARRHGIPSKIIDHAKRYWEGNESDISQIIREMSRKQRELIDREKELEKLEQDITEERESLDNLRSELNKKEAEIKRGETTELRRFLIDSRKNLENLIKELKEGEVSKEKTKRVKDYIGQLSEKTEKEEKIAEQLEEELYSPDFTRPIKPGIEVYVEPTGRKATVIEKRKKGDWIVSTGSMKINVPENRLTPVLEKRGARESQQQFDISVPHVGVTPSYEIDVRGERLDEAIGDLERQIDKAVLSGLSEFQVVHGKGTGALQKGIHDYLKQSNYIEDYYFAHPSQGGFGKTIVKLKKK